MISGDRKKLKGQNKLTNLADLTFLVEPFFSPPTFFSTTRVAFFGFLSSGFLWACFFHFSTSHKPRLWNIRPLDRRITPVLLISLLIGVVRAAFLAFGVIFVYIEAQLSLNYLALYNQVGWMEKNYVKIIDQQQKKWFKIIDYYYVSVICNRRWAFICIFLSMLFWLSMRKYWAVFLRVITLDQGRLAEKSTPSTLCALWWPELVLSLAFL